MHLSLCDMPGLLNSHFPRSLMGVAGWALLNFCTDSGRRQVKSISLVQCAGSLDAMSSSGVGAATVAAAMAEDAMRTT